MIITDNRCEQQKKMGFSQPKQISIPLQVGCFFSSSHPTGLQGDRALTNNTRPATPASAELDIRLPRSGATSRRATGPFSGVELEWHQREAHILDDVGSSPTPATNFQTLPIVPKGSGGREKAMGFPTSSERTTPVAAVKPVALRMPLEFSESQ